MARSPMDDAQYERYQEIRELLTAARAICARRGKDTAWERFDASIAKLGIGAVTARVYKVLPDDPQVED